MTYKIILKLERYAEIVADNAIEDIKSGQELSEIAHESADGSEFTIYNHYHVSIYDAYKHDDDVDALYKECSHDTKDTDIDKLLSLFAYCAVYTEVMNALGSKAKELEDEDEDELEIAA